jgi:hypothetical protein
MSKGFVIQTNWTHSTNFCVAVNYPAGKGITTAMVHGLKGEEIDYITNYLSRTVDNSDELIWFPLLLPIILMEYKAMSINTHVSTRYRAIYAIERKTGFSAQEVHNKNPSKNEKSKAKDNEIDFEDITHDITSASKELARYLHSCETNIRLIDLLDEIVKRDFPNMTDGDDVHVMDAALAKTAYLRSFFHGLSDRCAYMLDRAQAQRETVRNYSTSMIETIIAMRCSGYVQQGRSPNASHLCL